MPMRLEASVCVQPSGRISRRSWAFSRAVRIMPVYGTASRITVTNRLKSASLTRILKILREWRVVRRLESRERNRMRPDPEPLLQIDRVTQQRHDLEFPVVQAEQRSDPHVVDAGFHRAVHAVEPPEVVALDRVARVQLLVGLPVICLLEHLERADARVFQDAKLLDPAAGPR